MTSDAIPIAGQQWVQLSQEPWNRWDRQDQSYRKHQWHPQEDFAKGICPCIGFSIWENEVHGILAVFHLQCRKECQQFVCLIWHGVKLLERIQPIKPLEVAGTDPASAVVDDHRLIGAWIHEHVQFYQKLSLNRT